MCKPPRPTEIEYSRARCGQRKSRTIEEIIHDVAFQAERDRRNLQRIIE